MKSAMKTLPAGAVLLLSVALASALIGCQREAPRPQDRQLRYTVWDQKPVRSSRDRDDVMQTLQMSDAQILAWSQDSAAAEKRRLHGWDAEVHRDKDTVNYTLTNDMGSVGSRNEASAEQALDMSESDKLAWVSDEKSAAEQRTVTFFRDAYSEIIWRDTSGNLRFTARNNWGAFTGNDRDSVIKFVGTFDPEAGPTPTQVQAWAEDESAAAQERCAILLQSGYMEAISRGILERPPGMR
jgi:hypothetical protein